MTTLEDALVNGRGAERPFRCHVHGDNHASASVNVLKGVWYCYTCHASGVVDEDRIPTANELLMMLEPEKTTRRLPDKAPLVFGYGGYWAERFPLWVCWMLGMGFNPLDGTPTYPVHGPGGSLAGFAERADIEDGPKYVYPEGWSASATMFGSWGVFRPGWSKIIVVTEGAADAAACWEAGYVGLAMYGSGLNVKQVALLQRMKPSLVLMGQDNDKAGDAGREQGLQSLSGLMDVAPVIWSGKDPASISVGERRKDLEQAIGPNRMSMNDPDKSIESAQQSFEACDGKTMTN